MVPHLQFAICNWQSPIPPAPTNEWLRGSQTTGLHTIPIVAIPEYEGRRQGNASRIFAHAPGPAILKSS